MPSVAVFEIRTLQLSAPSLLDLVNPVIVLQGIESGNDEILKLMKNTSQRDAYFCSTVAFSDPGKADSVKWFMGKVKGKIALREHGKMGFGFDPIFAPSDEPNMTFAETTQEEKNKCSHRARALRKFGAWYIKHFARSEL
jgi:XTP/dITP diphosphohydrolase